MRYIFISLIILFSFSGCQDKEKETQAKHDALVAKKERAKVFAEFEAQKAQKTNTKLTQMGIDMVNGKITIDTTKSKDFFSDLNLKMEAQIEEIRHDLKKGVIQSKEAGIEINKKYIHIDLNKTKSLLEIWTKKIHSFAHEFDTVPETTDSTK
ncbi:MAG: hypothetical protein DRQ78_07755 [Epsilonproteobacteria bacterium]|nr:MAG: hypothetical protein DRQ78_07755 [Campylobacterota bacterium]